MKVVQLFINSVICQVSFVAFQSSLTFGIFQLHSSLHQGDYVEFIHKFFIGNMCHLTLRILSNLVQIAFKYISMVLAATAIMCSQYHNHHGFCLRDVRQYEVWNLFLVINTKRVRKDSF